MSIAFVHRSKDRRRIFKKLINLDPANSSVGLNDADHSRLWVAILSRKHGE
jgi:hypothetical protein